MLSCVVLYDYITVSLSIFLLLDTWDISIWGLMLIKLLRIFLYNPFCGHIFSFLLGKLLGVELLGQKVGVCLVFLKTARLFPKVIVLFYIRTSSVWEFLLLHRLSNTDNVSLFNINYSSGSVGISSCFILHLLNQKLIQHERETFSSVLLLWVSFTV